MNENLKVLSEDFFQNSLSTSPTSAMMRGHKEYFDQLEELTDETFEEEDQRVDGFISSCLLYTLTLPTMDSV